MILVIGSVALNHWLPERKIGNDIDIIAPYDEIIEFVKRTMPDYTSLYPFKEGKKMFASNGKQIIEAEIAWEGSNQEKLLELVSFSVTLKDGVFIAPPEVLLTLKRSHRFLKNSPHFYKTMRDIKLLETICADNLETHTKWKEWYAWREKDTYDYGHPKLNVSKGEFFTDSVPYKYDHDTIHEAVKELDRPAYKFFINGAVWCDKDLFFAQPERIKLLAVLEETYVLALERSQVPYPDTDPEKSFRMALEKVCTSITSGWFREYAWNNYDKVVNLHQSHPKNWYVNQFKIGLTTGTVKLHKKVA